MEKRADNKYRELLVNLSYDMKRRDRKTILAGVTSPKYANRKLFYENKDRDPSPRSMNFRGNPYVD